MGVEQTYRSAVWRVKPRGTSGVRMTLGSDGSTLAEYFGSAVSPAVLGLFNRPGSNRIVRVKAVRVIDPLPPVVSATGSVTLGRISTYAQGDDVAAFVPMNDTASFTGLTVSSWATGTISNKLRDIPSALDFPAWTSARPLVMTGSTPHTIGLVGHRSSAVQPIALRTNEGVALTDTGTEGRWRNVTAHFSDGTDTWITSLDVFFLGTIAGVLPWAAYNTSASTIYLTRLEITPISYWAVISQALLEVCRCSGMSGGWTISAIPNDTASTAFDAAKVSLATDCMVTLIATDSPAPGVPRDYPLRAMPMGYGLTSTRGPRWRNGGELIGASCGASPDASQVVLREGEGIAVRHLAIPLVHPGNMGILDIEVLFTVEDNTPPPSGGGGVRRYAFSG